MAPDCLRPCDTFPLPPLGSSGCRNALDHGHPTSNSVFFLLQQYMLQAHNCRTTIGETIPPNTYPICYGCCFHTTYVLDKLCNNLLRHFMERHIPNKGAKDDPMGGAASPHHKVRIPVCETNVS